MNSETTQSDFISRLKSLMGAEKPYPWAARVGIPQATFNRIWKEGIFPKGETLLLISEKTGASIDWLLTGKGEAKLGEDRYPLAEDIKLEGYVQVPRYEVSASAGGGAVIHSEQIVDHLTFKADWVHNALGVPVSQLALINVTGDSMEPTLSEGDLILIDMSHKGVKDNAVYVLQLNGSLLVKRIQHKLDGSMIVKSDNAVYEPERIEAESVDTLNVIGRVVWCGRRM